MFPPENGEFQQRRRLQSLQWNIGSPPGKSYRRFQPHLSAPTVTSVVNLNVKCTLNQSSWQCNWFIHRFVPRLFILMVLLVLLVVWVSNSVQYIYNICIKRPYRKPLNFVIILLVIYFCVVLCYTVWNLFNNHAKGKGKMCTKIENV